MYTIIGAIAVIFNLESAVFATQTCAFDEKDYPAFCSAVWHELPGINNAGREALIGIDAYAQEASFYKDNSRVFATVNRVFAFSTECEGDRDSCRFVSLDAAVSCGGKKAVLKLYDTNHPSHFAVLPCVLVETPLGDILDVTESLVVSLAVFAEETAHRIGASEESH